MNAATKILVKETYCWSKVRISGFFRRQCPFGLPWWGYFPPSMWFEPCNRVRCLVIASSHYSRNATDIWFRLLAFTRRNNYGCFLAFCWRWFGHQDIICLKKCVLCLMLYSNAAWHLDERMLFGPALHVLYLTKDLKQRNEQNGSGNVKSRDCSLSISSFS